MVAVTPEFQAYLDTLKRPEYAPLQKKEERELLSRYALSNDPDAFNELVNHNMRFVISRALIYSSNVSRYSESFNIEDLIQEGAIGLMDAIKNFDFEHESDASFGTFAKYAIDRHIQRFIHNNARVLRLPVHIKELEKDVNSYIRTFRNENFREPRIEEIAEALVLDEYKVQAILTAQTILYMDNISDGLKNPEKGETSSSFQNSLALSTPDFTEDLHNEWTEDSGKLLMALHEAAMETENPQRTLYVIQRHLGLDGKDPEIMPEIAKRLGVSKQSLYQLEHKVFDKIKKKMQQETEYDVEIGL